MTIIVVPHQNFKYLNRTLINCYKDRAIKGVFNKLIHNQNRAIKKNFYKRNFFCVCKVIFLAP